VTFAVLGVSLLIEGAVLGFAALGVARQRGEMPFFRYVREKADPAAVAILLEDSAAVLGVVLAACGIGLSYMTGDPRWDALASISVGLLLGAVAIYLVVQNRTLLLGRAVPDGVEQTFLQALRSRRSVCDVHDVKTRQLTPEAFKLKAEVTFDPAYLAPQLDKVLPHDPAALVEPDRQRTLALLAQQAIAAMGEEVDHIEEAVRAAIPEARHIDIEVHRSAAVSARRPAPVEPEARRAAGGG
jgi:zinc transporter 9